jgi:lipopolysaccharide heptosyltransferase II
VGYEAGFLPDTCHDRFANRMNQASPPAPTPTPDSRDPLFQESRDYVARGEFSPLPFEPIELPARPRILILKLSAIGDCLVASPLARALRERYPEAHLAWAVQSKAKTVVEGNPYLDEVIVQEKGLGGLIQTMGQVRRARFDAVLDVQGALKSAPISWATRAKWRVVSSRAEPIARRVANRVVPMPTPPPHALEQYLRVASALGIDPQTPRRLVLATNESEAAWADAFWKDNGMPERIVALNPGSARPIKAWPAAHFIELAHLLESRGIRTLLIGGPTDRETVAQIESAVQPRPFNAAGKTNLRQLGALLKKCSLLVSADTGPMHIAAGVGTPVVALFGPTDPRRTGPIGENHVVLTRNLPCRPCFQQPTCERYECLTDMRPQDVFEAVLRALESQETPLDLNHEQ